MAGIASAKKLKLLRQKFVGEKDAIGLFDRYADQQTSVSHGWSGGGFVDRFHNSNQNWITHSDILPHGQQLLGKKEFQNLLASQLEEPDGAMNSQQLSAAMMQMAGETKEEVTEAEFKQFFYPPEVIGE